MWVCCVCCVCVCVRTLRDIMEIQESNTVIFCCSRAFGLAPYLIRRTPKGRIADFALSVLLAGYSVTVLLALGE